MQTQVRKLIAGPGVHICDECVDLCAEAVEGEVRGAVDPSATVVLRREEAVAIRWHLAEAIDRHRLSVGNATDLLKRLDRVLAPEESTGGGPSAQ